MASEQTANNVFPIDWYKWSIKQLSQEFNIARDTVVRRLRAGNVDPSGQRRGHPVYSVSDAARAILMPDSFTSIMTDPDRMSPKERADWYKSENDRLKFEKENGLVVYADDCRVQMAEIAAMGLAVLETLPDILERDFNFDPEVIVSVEQCVDSLREQWANLMEVD